MADLRSIFGGRIERGGGVSIEIDPSPNRLASKMEAWAELVTDNRPFFEDAEDLIANHERRHFDSEGASTGRRFAPLSEPYGTIKASLRPGRRILEFDGHLRSAAVDRKRGYRRKIGKALAVFGISPSARVGGVRLADYARAHAFGVPSRNLPARPPYRWSENVRDARSLAFALSQLRQAHVVIARRKALGADSKALGPFGDAERSADRIDSIKRRDTR